MSLAEERDELIAHFENARVNPTTFNHREHVHVAWCYLQRYELYEATGRFTSALRRLTRHLGMPEKFHATITGFFMLVTAERMAITAGHAVGEEPATPAAQENWEEFCRRNPDLIGGASLLLTAHYSSQRLKSAVAKEIFVLPDRGTAIN